MATPAQIIEELKSMPTFVEQQKECGLDETAISELLRAQATCISAKMNSLTECDMKAATELCKAINGVGWESDTTAKLAQQVNDIKSKLESGKPLKRSVQKCTTFNLYLTEKEYDALSDDQTPWSKKFAIVKRRCTMIGLVLPTEKTKGHILECIYVASGLPLEKGKHWFEHLAKIKEALAPLAHSKVPFEHVNELPLSPMDLDQVVSNHAYSGDERPSMKEYYDLTFGTVRKSSTAWKSACGEDGAAMQLAVKNKKPMDLNLCAPSDDATPEKVMETVCKQIGAHLIQGMLGGQGVGTPPSMLGQLDLGMGLGMLPSCLRQPVIGAGSSGAKAPSAAHMSPTDGQQFHRAR